MGLLGSAFPLSFSKTLALLDQLLEVEISRGAIAPSRKRLSAALAQPKRNQSGNDATDRVGGGSLFGVGSGAVFDVG